MSNGSEANAHLEMDDPNGDPNIVHNQLNESNEI